MNYYEIAKKAYCKSGEQFDCRDCDLCQLLENNDFDDTVCKTKLIVELVKIIDEYKKYDSFLMTHGVLNGNKNSTSICSNCEESKHCEWFCNGDSFVGRK